jgi:replicative DNA helicase
MENTTDKSSLHPGHSGLGNKEFETCLIGACLKDETNIPLILGILEERDFSSPKYRIIFKAIQTLFNRNGPVDLISLNNELRTKGILPSELVEIEESFFDGYDLNYYIALHK